MNLSPSTEALRYAFLFQDVNQTLDVIQFSYAKSTLREYREIPCDKDFFQQRSFSESLKIAGELSVLAFKLIRNAIFNSGKHTHLIGRKLSFFAAIRFLESGMGALISPFNREIGSYFMEEALFHLIVYKKISNRMIQLLNQ